MDANELLTIRLHSLEAQLDRAERALGSPGIEPNLRKRAGHIFLNEILQLRTRVKNDLARLQQGSFSKTSWSSLSARERDCGTLFRECLAYLEGARARGPDVDSSLCEMADRLLDQLNQACELNWRRFTILGGEDFFSDQVQIIRLRFPCCGVWDLPVAAHEFGHFAAWRLNVAEGDGSHSLAFKDYVEAYLAGHPELGKEWKYYLNEFFADVFATYVLGPAYASTSLLLRFSIAAAHEESDQLHPSFARRAWVILETLRRLNQEPDRGDDFSTAISELALYWSTALDSAQRGELPQADREQLRDFVREFYGMLKRGAGNARYRRWRRAKELGPALRPGGGAPAGAYTIGDLLNAAWFARFEPNASAEKISGRVLALWPGTTAGED